jgi:hypothetical protein
MVRVCWGAYLRLRNKERTIFDDVAWLKICEGLVKLEGAQGHMRISAIYRIDNTTSPHWITSTLPLSSLLNLF